MTAESEKQEGKSIMIVCFVSKTTLWRLSGVLAAALVLACGVGVTICCTQPVGSVLTVAEGKEQREEMTLPIIMYHGVRSGEEGNRYFISQEQLREDLRYLKREGYTTVLLSQAVAFAKDPSKAPEKPIMITFDDGYWDNYLNAYPVLKELKCKAVISPIGRKAEEAESERQRDIRWSQCRWEELAEMCGSGLVELENHSYDLHSIKGGVQGAERIPGESEEAYRTRFMEDIQKANDLIFTRTGRTPQAFVYPFGAISGESREWLKEAGFEAAMDCEEKLNHVRSPEDLWTLHRFLRPPTLTSEHFFEKVLSEK